MVNPRQARALLAAVRVQEPSGPRLVAFFGVMYYAGLRPEEAISLRKDNLCLPPQTWDGEGTPDSDGWGELEFENASPDAGREWTDDGDHLERRQLKHRANGDSRPVPAHPELVALLREHLEEFGTAPDGRLGALEREQGDLDQARHWWKKAISTNHPDHAPRAIINLAYLEHDRGELDQARHWYQQAISTNDPEATSRAERELRALDLGERDQRRAERFGRYGYLVYADPDLIKRDCDASDEPDPTSDS